MWLCVLWVMAPTPILAQNISSVNERVTKSLRESEPGWKLTQDPLYPAAASSGVILLTWESNRISVEAVVMMSEARRSTENHYKDVLRANLFAGAKVKPAKDQSLKLGDKSFLWFDPDQPDQTNGIVFITGRVFVYLKTRDLVTAKRLVVGYFCVGRAEKSFRGGRGPNLPSSVRKYVLFSVTSA